MEQKEKMSSLDKLKHFLRRKADFGCMISVAKAERVVNLAYAAGRQSVLKEAEGLKWIELSFCHEATTKLGTTYFVRCCLDVDMYYLSYENMAIGVYFTVEEAKAFAEKDYKKRLKECLL